MRLVLLVELQKHSKRNLLNFDDTQNQEINQMWISVRCYDVRDIPIWVWVLAGTGVLLLAGLMIRKKVRQRVNL